MTFILLILVILGSIVAISLVLGTILDLVFHVRVRGLNKLIIIQIGIVLIRIALEI